MSTLEGAKIVVVGGSSGLGFGVAKASLLNSASEVIIASHNKERIAGAVSRLESAIEGKGVPRKVTGLVLDARDLQAVKKFFLELGEIDHLVWTSGDALRLGFLDRDLEKEKGKYIKPVSPKIAVLKFDKMLWIYDIGRPCKPLKW